MALEIYGSSPIFRDDKEIQVGTYYDCANPDGDQVEVHLIEELPGGKSWEEGDRIIYKTYVLPGGYDPEGGWRPGPAGTLDPKHVDNDEVIGALAAFALCPSPIEQAELILAIGD